MTLFTSLLFFALAKGAEANTLSTVAEQSQFTRTGRYEETVRLCQQLPRVYPNRVRCETFGTTPEQRPMVVLIASDDGVFQPKAARAKKRPVVLAQGGIHAGEIDGKDAGFWLLKELLAGRESPGLLKKVNFVFVPVFNVDGHERFGKNHRPNQVGPEEMGWRVTAQNLNLNRDYVKADAPEMQAMIHLLTAWDPILYADLHVTDGAKFQHDVSVQLEPVVDGTEALREAASRTRDALFKQLEAQGHSPLRFYPAFVKHDDPASGFAMGVPPPRFSTGYWRHHDRLSVLVETHSWKDYATRVKATRDVLLGLLQAAARDGASWLEAARQADGRDVGGREVPLTYKSVGKPKTIDFLGYAYTREKSSLSGQTWTRYDDKRPQVWKLPLIDEVGPALNTTAPRAGYIVSAAYAERVEKKLSLHGLQSRRLGKAKPGLAVESFRAQVATPSAKSFEGRQTMSVEGEWKKERRDIPFGSLFVPIRQRWPTLVVHLFEPRGPDSLLAWGDFNACFEQKEYIEDYVLEEEAREMLKKDPQLQSQLEESLKRDGGTPNTPEGKLRFFAERHPSWDERFNLYPVFRVDEAP